MASPLRLALLVLALLFLPHTLWAVETVKSPVVDEGLLEFEQKGKYQHDENPAKDNEKEFDLNAAYSPTAWWKTKGEFTFEQKRADDFIYKGFKWENILNLNGRDVQHGVVFGLYQDIFFADRTSSVNSFTLGALARRDFGKLSNIGNLLFKRDFGARAKNGLSLIYRWQTKYAFDPLFQPGFEVLGDTQTNDKFQDQVLMIGPVVYMSLDAITPGLGLDVGYLAGATKASRDGMLKWRLKYSIPTK
jgi:hypothetical protein